jgi:hypothetical protein
MGWPEEKIEFSTLMYEIKVLPLNYSGLGLYKNKNPRV